jgi:DNA-binding NarL/FixJ family response regulator
MKPCRIVLADDHVLLRQGLRRILDSGPGLQVVGEAGDGEELLRLLEHAEAGLVVLDLSMPGLGGIETLREIKKRYPEMKVLVLTMHRDNAYLCQALSAGADGYLLKEDADSELFSAIRKIEDGRAYISSILQEDLAEQWAGPSRPERGPRSLTRREKEILKMIADGKSSREIAEMLQLSPRTVERHRANIMRKLQLKRVADVVRYVLSKNYP